MQFYPVLTVKSTGEIHLRNRHHAIFQSAITSPPAAEDGSIVEVKSVKGEFLCYATYNSEAYICGRAIAFDRGDPMETLRRNISRAVAMRKSLAGTEDTNCWRLINAEGDGIPGLIVDQYGDIIVMQLTTMGMDKLRDWIADLLFGLCKPKAVFEKSTGGSRKKEGLEPKEGWVKGEGPAKFEVKERGLKYVIDIAGSQKTGFFLDQREMRTLVRTYAKGRTVLDCCSYVGGFSVNALAGGALAADAVDYDQVAIARAKEHVKLNGLNTEAFGAYPNDTFEFLRKRPMPRKYDFIVLDPPAFAKRSTDLEPAKKAYTDMNRMAFDILPANSLLLTCSCSYQMDQQLFQTAIFHAARQAKRFVRIIQRHRHAVDHPINLYHPEVDYLKSLLLWVE